MKTSQRKAIQNYLKNNFSHPTARNIYDALSAKGKGKISLATVYNTLALLKEKGLVREIAISNSGQKRYDANTTQHAHLICNACGKILDVDLSLHVGIPDERRKGFDIQDSEMNFYGLCSDCKSDNDKTNEKALKISA
jgi:Fur family peroxide stress response transcriptional regulator